MSFWKNLWHNAFGDTFPTFETMGRYSEGPPPTKVSMEMPPVKPPPQPSCFAKGIAISLKDEPEAWIEESEARRKVRLSIRHNQTQARLVWYDRWDRNAWGRRGCSFVECVTIDGAVLCDTDTAHVLSTIRAHPLGQYKEELDRELATAQKAADRQAYFECLGCPPSS